MSVVSRTSWSLVLVAALCLASAHEARAAAVWQVLSVQIQGDSQAWLDRVKQANVIRTRLNVATVRVAQATLAGEVTGTYFVDSEYPSLAAYADAVAKLEADAEWQALLKQFRAATDSKVVASALYVDRTPDGVKAPQLAPGGYATGLAIRLEGDPSAYLALLPKLEAAFQRVGVPAARVWQATLAGPETGTFVITTAYNSLGAYQEAQKKLEGDAEFQDLVRQAQATGRKIASSLLVRDRTP
jgi:cell fate (sporulation/competence/biofilm development) regulator YlbF (YheA/YmcA/DUF963 family)